MIISCFIQMIVLPTGRKEKAMKRYMLKLEWGVFLSVLLMFLVPGCGGESVFARRRDETGRRPGRRLPSGRQRGRGGTV